MTAGRSGRGFLFLVAAALSSAPPPLAGQQAAPASYAESLLTHYAAFHATAVTHELPRWIAPPVKDGFYQRFTGAYAMQSRLQPLYNALISWLPDSPHDMRQAAAALTGSATGEYALLGVFTAAAGLDVWLQRDAIQREVEIFYGLRTIGREGADAAGGTPVAYAAVRVRF